MFFCCTFYVLGVIFSSHSIGITSSRTRGPYGTVEDFQVRTCLAGIYGAMGVIFMILAVISFNYGT